MSADRRTARRAIYLGLVRDFAAAARTEAKYVETGGAEWQFYRGVQAAASDVLHDDVGQVRATDAAWLAGEEPAFRDGYQTASTILASAAAAPEARQRIVLPVMQRQPLNRT